MKAEKGLRFAALSLIGVLLFFVPVYKGMIPVVHMINGVKAGLGIWFQWVAVISCVSLVILMACAWILPFPALKQAYSGQGRVRSVFWAASCVIVLLKISGSELPFMVHPNIGGTILNLGSTVFITIAVAGTLTVFIIRSGLVEFMSVLMEPVMQPLFRLPGEAAVNILSSFVSSASVGVYFTEQYYIKKRYTVRQACSLVTGFSVVSVGYIGIIASLSGISEMYGHLLGCSFVLVLAMGTVMVRIPPLRGMADRYIDGTCPGESSDAMSWRERIRTAWSVGTKEASEFSLPLVAESFFQALGFAQKIVGVMIPTVMIVLILVYDTPVFQWLGLPLVPVLQLLRIPDAAAAAPSVLIGIVEVSLPSILIGGTAAAAKTRFFVALLSIVQIIFFSEAGNAILGSKIPLNAWRLIEIFLIRTAVALPLVAGVTHIVYFSR